MQKGGRCFMNYYVDIHADVLPELRGLHERSLTEQEAVRRLDMFRASNVKIAAAAPLYQPDIHTPDDFLAMRDAQIEALSADAQPMRLVGAAIMPLHFCMEQPKLLPRFALGDSAYLLVDLPREPVTEEFCEMLSRLRIVSGLCPVAVDIDRNYDIWSPEDWIMLRKTGMLLQVSVRGLMQQEYRKLSLYLLANQYAHFVASGSRRPDEPLQFTETMRLIQRSLPAQLYRRIKNNAGMLLSGAEPSSFLSE